MSTAPHADVKRSILLRAWPGALMAIVCCSSALSAEEKVAVRAPFFQGEALPAPPQQNAPWKQGDDALSNAAATLFEQGLANPAGLEYREIAIAIGNPWDGGGYKLETHGWVLPDDGKGTSFAVAWDGLVYPALRVGKAADLHQDWAPKPLQKKVRFGMDDGAGAVTYDQPSAIKLALLLRLGEGELASQLSERAELKLEKDPYLAVANDWAWAAFERAVCAHERGDDRLALADARLLTRVQPLIEAEAERRGCKRPLVVSSSHLPMPPPYLSFLGQLPDLLADSERRVGAKDAPGPKDSLAAQIDDLQNVAARQESQPGGVWLPEDARVQALVKRGNEVVEPLLAVLENDTRLTRSVSFGRDFHRSRNLLTVSDAAHAALEELLHVRFRNYGEKGQPLSKKEMAAQFRDYWSRLGMLAPMERLYATLKDDTAGADLWLQAAAHLVQPADVESRGGGTRTPKREPGAKIDMRGEVLRDGRAPSVSELLARRSDDIAAIRTRSTNDHFLYVNAGTMALHLAAWDKAAALPVLQKRLARAWSIGAEPHDILAFNGDPVEHFGSIIAEMTLARVECGDDAAYDEYAEWIQKASLKRAFFQARSLQKPLAQGAARPSIAQAIDYLFNDPQSPWSDVLAPGNGAWSSEFWHSTLPMTAGFRRQALRALADKTEAGTITFHPPGEWNSRMEAQIQMKQMGMGYRGSNGDPDVPPPGQKCAFRTCDAFAYFYAQNQKGPACQLFWPEAKRDAAVLACRRWLEAAP